MRRHDPERVLSAFGRRTGELRRERGLTQEQLAERLEVSLQYVQRIEGGRANLSIRSLVKLANALQVNVAELLAKPRSSKRTRGRPSSSSKRGS